MYCLKKNKEEAFYNPNHCSCTFWSFIATLGWYIYSYLTSRQLPGNREFLHPSLTYSSPASPVILQCPEGQLELPCYSCLYVLAMTWWLPEFVLTAGELGHQLTASSLEIHYFHKFAKSSREEKMVLFYRNFWKCLHSKVFESVKSFPSLI